MAAAPGGSPPTDPPTWGPRSGPFPGPPWRDGRRRGVSWAGVLLVLFGAALLLQQLGSPIGADGLVLAAIAIGFAYAWLGAGEPWALIPAAVFAALAAASVGHDLGWLPGSGWTALFLGLAFLGVWAFGRVGPFRHTWAIWPAAFFLLVALAEFGDRIPGFPGLGQLWPVVLVLAGLWLILTGVGRAGRT